jgi:phospholipid/cholesterol/gamma-HCH transport system ATP-binding protein
MPTPPEILRVSRVSKSFGGQKVLDELDLSVRAGENLAIIGKSGTGKSVLLRIINGLMPADEGTLLLWGQPTGGLTEEEWVPLRRRMGMVFQSGALFDSMTVFDNIAFPLRERDAWSADEIRGLVEERLEWVELPGIGEQYPSQLSGGMRRRVALARTLAYSPEFILYDEPTTGLDPLTAQKISVLMRNLDTRMRSTSILVTHDIQSARIVSSRWAYLSAGKVLADGTPEELEHGPEGEVREFLRAHDSAPNLRYSGGETAAS